MTEVPAFCWLSPSGPRGHFQPLKAAHSPYQVGFPNMAACFVKPASLSHSGLLRPSYRTWCKPGSDIPIPSQYSIGWKQATGAPTLKGRGLPRRRGHKELETAGMALGGLPATMKHGQPWLWAVTFSAEQAGLGFRPGLWTRAWP